MGETESPLQSRGFVHCIYAILNGFLSIFKSFNVFIMSYCSCSKQPDAKQAEKANFVHSIPSHLKLDYLKAGTYLNIYIGKLSYK